MPKSSPSSAAVRLYPHSHFLPTLLTISLEAEYKKFPVAAPGPDELLINVKYSGVCHSDVHALKGDWPTKPSHLP